MITTTVGADRTVSCAFGLFAPRGFVISIGKKEPTEEFYLQLAQACRIRLIPPESIMSMAGFESGEVPRWEG